MATHGSPAPTPPRRFGLTVGGVFLALGCLSWWRGHEIAPLVLWGLGGALVVPALVAPALLVPVERGWMRFAGALAWVNTRIILGLVYFVVVTPVGLVMRLFRDPLNRRLEDDPAGSDWVERPREPADPARYRHQF